MAQQSCLVSNSNHDSNQGKRKAAQFHNREKEENKNKYTGCEQVPVIGSTTRISVMCTILISFGIKVVIMILSAGRE
jgi:hypothetical protein